MKKHTARHVAALLAAMTLSTGCLAAAPTAKKAAATPAAPNHLWWEAEKPNATNFPPVEQNPFKPNNAQEAEVLSGGAWIGATDNRTETLFLEYDVNVPRAGAYTLYARKFWHHGPFRWRFDNGAWTDVRQTALLDEVSMRQFTGANWVEAGTATLTPGKHRLRVELLEKTGAAAFDAFVLTPGSFTARGKLKPGEKYNRAPQGWFAWEPDPDPFRASPIDMRGLNEAFAGQNGFIQAKNGGFVHGKTGKPVRFWAVNAGNAIVDLPAASTAQLARTLAKYGVNMVRIHGDVWGDDFRQTDRAHLDRLHRFVAAMKREGIYTCLSIYFPLWMQAKEADFTGYGGGKNPFALLFFNPEFQRVYQNWWRTVLTTPNPYANNTPLSADPALAVVELVNEDSYLFWTFTPYENIPGPQMAILEKQFGDWLTQKYGGVDKALAAWNTGAVRGDDASVGRAGFMPLSDIFNKKDRRAQDTATFLAQHQKAFFERQIAFLKRDLGYTATIYGSNWITANPQILGPLDKYSNTVADVMDRHGYFDAPHQGPRASYSLSAGDKYEDRSALQFLPEKTGGEPNFSLPIMDISYNGLPSTISEINWTPPNRFRADLPLLAAAYGSLQSTDAFYFFALGGSGWQDTHAKFDLQTPVMLGQFPATAWLYRKGLVREAPPVADVNLKVGDLFALKGAPVAAPVNLDELRKQDIPAGQTATVGELNTLDPLAFLVGRVQMRFTETGGPDRIADFSRYIDRDKKTVRSQTGQLAWNWNDGRVVVNAPQAQGVTGFLQQAGNVRLGDMTVRAQIPYGTVLLVALDDKPIKQSSRLLLQVMSEDQNFGWDAPEIEGGKREIKNLGAAPIVVRRLAGTVSLARPDAARLKVTALDHNGYRKGAAGTAKSLTLQPTTLYYLIEK